VPIFGATFLYLAHAVTVNRWAKTKGNLTEQLLEDTIVSDAEISGNGSEQSITSDLIERRTILNEPLPHTLTMREAMHPFRSLIIGLVSRSPRKYNLKHYMLIQMDDIQKIMLVLYHNSNFENLIFVVFRIHKLLFALNCIIITT
jgi:hypothetical protein